MIAVGIDPSLTSTGVAILINGQPAAWSRHGRPGHNGATYQSRSRRIRKLVAEATNAVLSCGQPDLVVIEEQIGVRFSGSEFDRSAVWHGIFGNLDARNIPIVVIGNQTHKAWVTGTTKAGKADITAHVNLWYAEHFPEPLNAKDHNDIADAFGFAAIGAYHLGDPLPFEIKARHTTGLEKVQWPVTA